MFSKAVNKYGYKKAYISCECTHADHLLVFSCFEDDDIPEVYVHQYWKVLPWYKRIKVALGYIFRPNAFELNSDETLMSFETTKELNKWLSEFIEKGEQHGNKSEVQSSEQGKKCDSDCGCVGVPSESVSIDTNTTSYKQ